MIVNQSGRPSKVGERRAEILQATLGLVAKEGLAGVTFAKIAEATGLQRTLVLHYFGNRDELVEAFIDHAVSAIGAYTLHRNPGDSVRQRISSAFAPGAYRTDDDLAVWTEMVALSARDTTVRQRLRALWTEHWLPDLESQLVEQYPGVPRETIDATAYTLACLFEAHWAFSVQDVVNEERQRQVERMALFILDRLEHGLDDAVPELPAPRKRAVRPKG